MIIEIGGYTIRSGFFTLPSDEFSDAELADAGIERGFATNTIKHITNGLVYCSGGDGIKEEFKTLKTPADVERFLKINSGVSEKC